MRSSTAPLVLNPEAAQRPCSFCLLTLGEQARSKFLLMTIESPQAVEACHELIRWMIPRLDHLPRKRRYTLGSHIENALLDILENLVAAAYSRNKRKYLQAASLKLGRLQHLWRLVMELELVSKKRYRFAADQITAIGRQVGAWQQSANE